MTDTTNAPQVDATANTPAPTPNDVANTVNTPAVPETPATEPVAEPTAPETFDADYVKKLRAEAASYRTKAKEVEEAKAGELDAFKQEMAKALGLVEDTSDDPAKLLEAATKREQDIAAERDTFQQQLREYRQRDAIREASTTAKITDHALLEAVLKTNNAFNALDINADDYAAQVAQFITEAVQAHPALAQVAPTASGVDTNTTNSGAKGKLSPDDLARLYAEGKYDEINKAATEGRIA